MEVAPYVLLGAGIFAPPIALIGWCVVRGLWRAAFWRVVLGCGLCLLVLAIGYLTGVRIFPRLLEIVLCALAYLVFCFVLTSSLTIRKLLLRIPAVILALVPVICGYALTVTPLMVPLVFVVGDWAQAPERIEKFGGSLECRVTRWGAAFTDEGYTVHLFKIARFAPIFERELVTIVVDETEEGNGPASATCADAMKAYVG